MSIYILLAIFSIIMIIFNDFSISKKNINISSILSGTILLIMFIISASRMPSVGADTIIYIQYFDLIKELTLQEAFLQLPSLESGYILLNKILAFFTTNSQIITIFNSLLLILTLTIFSKKTSKNILLTLFLFIILGFYQSSFNIVRSCYAVFLAYIALTTYEKSKTKSIILYIIAFLFHKSIIVLLLVPLLNILPINKKNIKYYLLIIALLYLSLDYLLPYINYLIPSQYSYYAQKETEGIIEKALLLIVHISLFIFTSSFIKNKASFIEKNKIFYIFIILETLFYCFSIKYAMFTRVAYIFSMYTIISIPNIIENIENTKTRNKIKYIVIFACLIQFIIRLFINNIGGTIPYHSLISWY